MSEKPIHLLLQNSKIACGEKFAETMLLHGTCSFIPDNVTCEKCRKYIDIAKMSNENLYKLYSAIKKAK